MMLCLTSSGPLLANSLTWAIVSFCEITQLLITGYVAHLDVMVLTATTLADLML